jgi:hypothetical protein
MADQKSIKLKIPPQDQQELRVFQPDSSSAANWAETLPVNDSSAAANKLDEALADLNRTTLSPDTRYQILEALAPALDRALTNLAKRFLNQPLVLPEQPRAMAKASDQLMSAVTTGYAIVAIEAIQKGISLQSKNPAQLIGAAIQRALQFAGRKILQTYQLHKSMEPDAWRILHQLYALAEQQRVTDLPVPESGSDRRTIKATYVQALALSCCKPNQLRQGDLTAVYRGLKKWGDMVQVENREKGDELFLVDLNSDQPVQYRALYRERPDAELRVVNTSTLVARLKSLKEDLVSKEITFDKDTSVALHVLDHFIASLGSISMRNFKRTASNSPLWICVGLDSAHYHINQQQLKQQLQKGDRYVATSGEQEGDNIFKASPAKRGLRDEAEAAMSAFGGDGTGQGVDLDNITRAMLFPEEHRELPERESHVVFEVQLADTSPNGYCLEWLDEIPADLKSGDIVGLKEDKEQNEWSIAAIRWLSRLRDSRTLVGLELLSPRAIAYAGRVARKGRKEDRDEPPVRVLFLPAIKIVGQPSTLITPRTRFKERQKLVLRNSIESRTIQLMRQISSTGSYEQFEFSIIKELGDVLAEQGKTGLGGEYDSIWSNI